MASGTSSTSEEYVEGVVCNEDEINENEMKVLDLEDVGKILLVKQKGKLTAIGAKCTHAGALLSTGALGDGRVRCPWHGACFNITTGDIEDFPGLDSLPCYQVKVENNQVKVRARKNDVATNKRLNTMSKLDLNNNECFVVIGAGPAGGTCVETLRQEGFTGRIVLISKENSLPYDRVKISKAMDMPLDKIQFRNDSFYRDHDIEVMKGIAAIGVDTNEKLVKLDNGNDVGYSKLFIATGCKAVKTPIPGVELKNIEVLRNFNHAAYVHSQLTPDKEIVVLGSSYIALEAASYSVNKVKKVTVVMRSDVPFKPLLGPRIGAAFKAFFEEKGVVFIPNSGIKRCIDDGHGFINSVELINDEIIKADLCIMGVGSRLYTDFLKSSQVDIREDGSIEVDDFMETNVKGVYAGGDLAYAPVWSYRNIKSVIGHYPLAHMHGKIAALNMLEKKKPLKAVPFFWTMLFGKGIRYAGHGKYTDIVYSGDVEGLKFVAFYLDEDEVVAVSSCQMDPIVSEFAEILAQGKKLYRKDLTGDDHLGWRH
nr:apoptosis-inducing factor 3 isoform X2 [Onthophagus taurus]